MIVVSMLLVIVGAVALVIGVFFGSDDNLTPVYVSIASCVLAGLFLVAGIVRNRPSRKPVLSQDGAEATWSGATAWPGGAGETAEPARAPGATTAAPVLERDAERDEPHIEIVTAGAERDDPTAAVMRDEPTSAELTGAADDADDVDEDDEDEDVVVVPKRAAEPIAERTGTSGRAAAGRAAARKAAPAEKAGAKKAAPAKKAAAKKTTAKKSTAKKTTVQKGTGKKAAPAKKAAAKKTTAQKGTGKKAAPAKKAAAKKTTAKKTTAKKITRKRT